MASHDFSAWFECDGSPDFRLPLRRSQGSQGSQPPPFGRMLPGCPRSLTDSQRFASRNSNCMFGGFVRGFDAQVWRRERKKHCMESVCLCRGVPRSDAVAGDSFFHCKSNARAVTALGWLLATLCPEIYFFPVVQVPGCPDQLCCGGLAFVTLASQIGWSCGAILYTMKYLRAAALLGIGYVRSGKKCFPVPISYAVAG